MNSDGGERVSRRGFLRAGVGVAAAGVAATGTAGAAEEGGDGPKTITVGPGGNPTFEPAEAYVTPGTTVEWVWESDGHNVSPESTPEGVEWTGHPEVVGTGTTYEHTFEEKGVYEYVCTPHANMGMTGTIEVTDNPPEDTGYQSILPSSAKTLGVAAVGSMTSILGISYVFMKYGGDYGDE